MPNKVKASKMKPNALVLLRRHKAKISAQKRRKLYQQKFDRIWSKTIYFNDSGGCSFCGQQDNCEC